MKTTILIVEDEPAIADTLQYTLESDGFGTICLGAGNDVPTVLEESPVDLVILDVGLPDINGFELCKRIRRRYTLPIIFLTARADEIDRVVGLEIGGDDYVTKPFSPRELSARVKAVLRRVAPDPAPRGSRTGFEIDPSRRRISWLGKSLDLSRYEYNLLAAFIRRPGHVFSREQLMRQAWDEPEASMDRTVDAHIKNIRAKLKAVNADIDPIVTHRGTGYALKEKAV
jgi:two-component system catabolic regulation response regulator CreB